MALRFYNDLFFKSSLMHFCTLILLFAFPLFSFAQDITGNVEGRVVDSTGVVLNNINVSLQSSSLQGIRGATTNEKGYFRILSLPVGEYIISVSAVGFGSLNIEKVQVLLGKTTNLGDIKLREQAISLPEITVSGKKPVIDPVSTTYGGNINSASFEQLPVDRNYRNIATLLPQANTSFYGDEANIGGATGFENKYFVDGVEVTDPLIGANSTNLPYNFIQEIEVKTGGYDVDNRASLGGLINVVTYSGSNEFHGSVFGFYTSNKLAENQKYGSLDVNQGDFTNYDFGFGLGGPIILDKLWFYAAYNPNFNNRDVEVPNFGTYVDKTLINSFAGKLSWKALDNLNLIFTITGDPTKRDAVGRGINVPPDSLTSPDTYLQDIVEGGVNYSLSGTYWIGKKNSLQGLVARVDRRDTGEGATEIGRSEVFYVDYLNNVWSGGVGSSWDSYRHSTVGRISANFLLGDHILNGGVEYKTNGVNNIYDYRTIERYDSIYYGEAIGKGWGEVSNRIPSVFVQDSWRIFQRLNVTAGIRWDGHTIIGSNGEVAQTIEVPLQPRIGIVFLPDENGTNRIYGSYGRFSQEYALFQSVNYHSESGYDYWILFDHDPRVDNTGGDTLYNFRHIIRPEVEDLQAQYYDEFSIGYERLIGWGMKAGIQGVYRTLGQGIDDVWLPDESRYQYGNPGSGFLSEWPKPQRDYTALILSIQRTGDEHFNFLASYVLSRDYGNYEGLFDASYHGSFPNANSMFDDLSTATINTTGLVPNDRTHVFKFSGSYRFSFGLVTGISFIAQSGTPLSEFAYTDFGVKYLSPRGSAGRTPAIWDLNARLMYELDLLSTLQPRLILDLFHIASQRKEVDIDQRKYFGIDENGEPINPNPTYGQAYRYQPSFSLRLGIEIGF
ncbi:MAG: TonB-dependent receptor [Ignavibacterium sp.]|jgi:hypothetical protein|nr:TonB-dependent receptor [Ignavibacterium sp.]